MTNCSRIFLTTLLVMTAYGAFAQSEQLPEKMRQRMAKITAVPVEQLQQAYSQRNLDAMLPFVAPLTAAGSVRHDLMLPQRKQALPARSFFNEQGEWLAAESVQKISDPRRMSRANVEKVMSNIGQRVIARKPLTDEKLLDQLWQVMARRVPLAEIQEFNISYVDYQFEDGSHRPAFIVNIWGPRNPLNMPDGLPEVLQNRIRLIYDPQRQELSADNLL